MRRHGVLEALGRKLGVSAAFAEGTSAESLRQALIFATAYPALVAWLDASPHWWTAFGDTRLPAARELRTHERALGKLREGEPSEWPQRLAGYVRQELVRIAYRELFANGNPVAETARELSDLAEAAIAAVTAESLAWASDRFGPPLDEHGVLVPFVVFGMGKLGGRELNAGSDVDLIFFHGDAEDAEGALAEHFGRVGARIVSTLEASSASGAAYRVDMRLRPEGKNGPLVHSLSRAERYYETWGRAWERIAMVRARPIAGSMDFGAEMQRMLQPFVWRRRVDPELAEEAGRMVEEARAQRGAQASRRDLKLGQGGIREAEFFAQSLCLVWGGREPALRVRHTLEQIRKLRAKGYVTDREARDLLDAYVILRSVEHRVQFATWEQTHDLPTPGPLLDRVAASFGFTQAAEFEARIERTRRRVGEHFRRLTNPKGGREGNDFARIWSSIDEVDAEALDAALAERGLEGFDELGHHVLALARRPDFPFGKLTRSTHPRFAEALAEALFDAADPESAARLIGQFFARLETPSVYANLFEQEPRALLRFVSLTGGSTELGERLVGHPELVDGILFATAEDPSAPLPGVPALTRAYEIELARAQAEDPGDALEETMIASRRLKAETTVRIGVRDLGGEVSPEGVAATLSGLADVLVQAALRAAGGDRGLAAIGMGKYGGGELSYGSDLDLFFLYDPNAWDDDATPYRIATRVLRLLSMTHAEGPGYELDTRLRPSGNQGLLVTSEQAFARYHGLAAAEEGKRRAEAWERQALIKARFVAGDAELGARSMAMIERIAYEGGAPDLARVLELRLRMEREMSPAADSAPRTIDIKLGKGGLVDIEFLVQTAQMAHGQDVRVRSRSTEGGLRALIATGLLEAETGQTLLRHYGFFRRLEQRLRIVYGRSDALVVRGGAQILTLARRLGFFGDARRPEDELVETLTQTMAEVRALFLQAMAATRA